MVPDPSTSFSGGGTTAVYVPPSSSFCHLLPQSQDHRFCRHLSVSLSNSCSLIASMAAESESDTGFSRNREFSILVPLILGVMGPRREAGDRTEEEEGQQSHDRQERIVLINPFTQGMVVIHGGGSLEALVREISEMEAGKAGLPPASRSAIEAMPTVAVEAETDCAICLDAMEEAKEMPCKHRYHQGCIEQWLGIHGSCPVCRFTMPPEEARKGAAAMGGGGRRGEIWVDLSASGDHPRSVLDGDDQQ